MIVICCFPVPRLPRLPRGGVADGADGAPEINKRQSVQQTRAETSGNDETWRNDETSAKHTGAILIWLRTCTHPNRQSPSIPLSAAELCQAAGEPRGESAEARGVSAEARGMSAEAREYVADALFCGNLWRIVPNLVSLRTVIVRTDGCKEQTEGALQAAAQGLHV